MTCSVCGSEAVGVLCSAEDRLIKRETSWRVLRCRDCQFGWTDPPLPEHTIASYYPPTYLGDYESTVNDFKTGVLPGSRSWRKEKEKVLLVEEYVLSGKILDVGCADARFLLALDGLRWERWGVELSKGAVEVVRRGFPELKLVWGDVQTPALPAQYFDAITLWHVLEHLPRTGEVLARLHNLLAPGGFLFVSLPNVASHQAELFGRFWYAFDDVPRHLYHFSPVSLGRLLQQAGFEVSDRVFFSRLVNYHCLKHSLLNWSQDRFRSRLPYYALKPLLFAFPPLESVTGRYGIMTFIARKA